MLDASEYFKVLQDQVPHVAKNVQLFWGNAGLNTYISSLLFDTRSGSRLGFPKEVASALLMLNKINSEEHPIVANVHKAVFDGHGSIWGRDTFTR